MWKFNYITPALLNCTLLTFGEYNAKIMFTAQTGLARFDLDSTDKDTRRFPNTWIRNSRARNDIKSREQAKLERKLKQLRSHRQLQISGERFQRGSSWNF